MHTVIINCILTFFFPLLTRFLFCVLNTNSHNFVFSLHITNRPNPSCLFGNFPQSLFTSSVQNLLILDVGGRYIFSILLSKETSVVFSVFYMQMHSMTFAARCITVQSAVLRSHVVCLSVRLSVCDIGGSRPHRLEITETDLTDNQPNPFALHSPKVIHLI